MTPPHATSVFAGFRFLREMISLAVRWYLRYGLSYRDVEELLAERGITVDHVTIYQWVQRFTPESSRQPGHAAATLPGTGGSSTNYVKVAGAWPYLYRAVDQHDQVIDVTLSTRRDLAAARRFFTRALSAGTVPTEVTTDRAPVYPRVFDELVPSALPTVEQHEQPDPGRPRTAESTAAADARTETPPLSADPHRRTCLRANLRHGHYDIATGTRSAHRLRIVFDDLALAI